MCAKGVRSSGTAEARPEMIWVQGVLGGVADALEGCRIARAGTDAQVCRTKEA